MLGHTKLIAGNPRSGNGNSNRLGAGVRFGVIISSKSAWEFHRLVVALQLTATTWRGTASNFNGVRNARSRIDLSTPSRNLLLAALVFTWLGLPHGVCGQPATNPPAADPTAIVLPRSVPDPLERMNRGIWAFNVGLLRTVIQPTAKGYRVVVRKPVRQGIGNFSRNLTYPDRLLNNLLQGKWSGARDESYRFALNTTVGLAGFIDVASHWKIAKSDADFGQTFGKWGWQPGFFLMLPAAGPSNDRDTVGLAADSAANPLQYLSPYAFNPGNPLTFPSPYTYFAGVSAFNDLSDSADSFVRFSQTQMDPYADIQYAWTFVRQGRVANFQVKGRINRAALETLESVFFTYKDPEFPGRGKTRSVRLADNGRRLEFTYWLQPHPAPVVYIVPGLGSHRLSDTVLALAELVYDHGFSAVSVSSSFNYDFLEHGATASVPGYTPVDVHDLHVALTAVDARLRRMYPHRLGDTALMGYSMGAFQSLYLAATEGTHPEPLLKFNRYVAIDSPVRLLYGMDKLDEFYRAPLAWPAGERTADIENTFLKVATLARSSLTPQTTLPFDAVESEFIIGFVFRTILLDAIYTSQRLDNLGVLRQPLSRWKREPVYDEIFTYSYHDYSGEVPDPLLHPARGGFDCAGRPRSGQRSADLSNRTAHQSARPAHRK